MSVDFVQRACDVQTGETVAIVILDTADLIAQELSVETARDAARHLIALADEWERSKPLRRSVAVSEQLQGLDG
ncbi:hypothetical protein [Microbacterium sp. 22296]|uniref:hypothetical protein n=1 Tax=Microbacterium sp. 22296 TaxID=3453903 RepID=UPI003F83D352